MTLFLKVTHGLVPGCSNHPAFLSIIIHHCSSLVAGSVETESDGQNTFHDLFPQHVMELSKALPLHCLACSIKVPNMHIQY